MCMDCHNFCGNLCDSLAKCHISFTFPTRLASNKTLHLSHLQNLNISVYILLHIYNLLFIIFYFWFKFHTSLYFFQFYSLFLSTHYSSIYLWCNFSCGFFTFSSIYLVTSFVFCGVHQSVLRPGAIMSWSSAGRDHKLFFWTRGYACE